MGGLRGLKVKDKSRKIEKNREKYTYGIFQGDAIELSFVDIGDSIVFSSDRRRGGGLQGILEPIRTIRGLGDDNFLLVGSAIVLMPRFSGSNIIQDISMWICVKALWWMT